MINVSPSNTAAPVLSGTASVGETLTVSTGTWSGSGNVFDYQWARCDAAGDGCVDIDGATDPSYLATIDDQDATLRVTVTATNSVGDASESSLSDVVGAPDVGAYQLNGTCGALGVTGPGFVLTGGTKALPVGTQVTVIGSGVSNIGSWTVTGGTGSVAVLSGTARLITLTSALPAGATMAFRTTLSISIAFTLNAATTLPSGYSATGGKSAGSVSSTLVQCSAA